MKRPEITIRPGRLDDAEQEAALHRSVDWCYDEALLIAEYHDDAYEPSSVIVAEMDGEVVGKIELFVGRKAKYRRFGMIRRFVVREDMRASGIGRALLEAATEHARASGCTFIELSVDVTNPAAHAFYQREGYVEDRVEIMMRKPLTDEPYRSNYLAQKSAWEEESA